MTIEFVLTDAQALRRSVLLLNDLGHRAEPGREHADHSFTVRVLDVDEVDVTAVRGLVASVDPGAYRVAVTGPAEGMVAPRAA